MERIPLVDLSFQHKAIAARLRPEFDGLFERSSYILGETVAAFEREFAAYCRLPHCVGVASGTDALELLLRAAGVGPGDEVLVPANTFVATALAVALAGARPAFVDCDPEHMLIDPAQATLRVGPKTKAILAVHLYGQIAPMEEINALAERRGLLVFEDAAQAHGAKRRGKGIGHWGRGAGVSFYPSKNLGAYGDGGAVLTASEELAAKLRRLRQYGSEKRYHHPELGKNSRLDELQAAVLRAKLTCLDAWNELRREAARRYEELFRDIPDVRIPRALAGNEHVWHLYVIRVPRRDEVQRSLTEAGIDSAIHYPIPLHLQGAFKDLGHAAGDFPETERAAGEILSLPLYPGITPAQQERVAQEVRKALAA